jgi:hypothetical protein
MWEKANLFQIKIEINNFPLQIPRINDRWLMRVFEDIGYRDVDLIGLNRVWCYQQIIFLLDILDVGSRVVDNKYAQHCPCEERWWTFTFPQEQPSAQDFRLWEQALEELAHGACTQYHIRPFIVEGHKIWN